MPVNPSTAAARVIIDELLRSGVQDIVLAPGSRNAPLALAAADAAAGGFVTLHVRFDERSAGYLALGLAKVGGAPVAVITTSGTAAVNLAPAVVEAYFSRVPLVAITADRPPELHNVGANQTIDQQHLFGTHVRGYFDLGVPRSELRQVQFWRSTVSRACSTAADVTNPGPVQLNAPFAAPLVPDDDFTWLEDTGGRVDSDGEPMPWTIDARMIGSMSTPIDDILATVAGDATVPSKGVIIVGDHDDEDALELLDELASALGWPVISEPSGNANAFELTVTHAPLLLSDVEFVARHQPQLVLTIGNVGLTRAVMKYIGNAPLHIAVGSHAPWSDPTRSARAVIAGVPLPPEDVESLPSDDSWWESWRTADAAAESAIEEVLSGAAGLTGPAVARSVAGALAEDQLMFLGASWPSRHVEAYATTIAGTVISNRGTSGIDGAVSTAIGAAISHQRAGGGTSFALMGDLTFLYDSNGLVTTALDEQPDLVIVVSDNDGGGIFSTLEQSDIRFANVFERVFGTPHGRNLVDVATALGVPAVEVATVNELDAQLDAPTDGIRVVVAHTGSRAIEAALLDETQQAISRALI